MDTHYTIKQTSLKTNIPRDTLRYYDKIKLVCPQRQENGYRYYSEEDLLKLRYLSVMKYAHFSLDDIKQIFNLFEEVALSQSKEDTEKFLIKKQQEIDHIIENFQNISKLLGTIIEKSNDLEALHSYKQNIDTDITQLSEEII